MSRVWLSQAITLVGLAGLGAWWWWDYSRHRRTGALAHVQRLRAWRLFGLVLLIAGLVLELAPIWTSFDAQMLLAVPVGFGGCTVVVTWLALAAHRRYPGLVLNAQARGHGSQCDRENK